MPKTKLTSAFCRDITCPPHKRKEVWRCAEQIGFGIEVRASSKTYWQYFTDDAGRAKQIKIGAYSDITFEQAKRKARDLRSQIVLGGDPGAEKAERKKVPTFAELAQLRIEHAQAHLKSHATIEMSLRKYLIPWFGKLPINQITSQAIEKKLGELRQFQKPASVDRLRLVMNKCYRQAKAWNLPGSERNPVEGVARIKYDNKRTCLLSAAEVDRILEACGKSNNPLLRPIVALLLATAARRRELLDAKLEHIDFERREWLIPKSKNGHARRVPLSDAALSIIKELPQYEGCPWLLPNPKTLKPFDNIKHAWATARKLAGFPDLHLHDLRHASIGAMINNGVDLYVAGKVAGHLRPESTARYAYVADKTLAAAVKAGAENLQL